jgi:hypothetical protein
MLRLRKNLGLGIENRTEKLLDLTETLSSLDHRDAGRVIRAYVDITENAEIL